MKPVFGDTVYFLALVNPADQFHRQAVAVNQQPTGPLVTTEWVLTEVGDALSQPMNRRKFTRLLELLRQQPDVEIVPASTDLFRRACDLHSQRTDKDWSLTDCISFTVMADRGDHGFPDLRPSFRTSWFPQIAPRLISPTRKH